MAHEVWYDTAQTSSPSADSFSLGSHGQYARKPKQRQRKMAQCNICSKEMLQWNLMPHMRLHAAKMQQDATTSKNYLESFCVDERQKNDLVQSGNGGKKEF